MTPATARDCDGPLALGWLGILTSLRELQQRCRFTDTQAARALLVSPETFRRWRTDRPANPTAVRLLAVLAGYVPWVGWEGWELHNGLLFPPGYSRGGIPPSEFFALVFYRQQVTAYQDANAKLRERISGLEADLERLRSGLPISSMSARR
jgi:hypothetical protein